MNVGLTQEQNLVINLYECSSKLEKTKKALVLFDVSSCLLAIGNDAEKLYFEFGWEMTEFQIQNRIYSYMFVLPDCLHILLTCCDIHRSADSLLECTPSFATTQQQLDVLRKISGEKLFSFPFVIDNQVTYKENNYVQAMRLTAVNIYKDKINLLIDNRDTILLAKNTDWQLSSLTKCLLKALGNLFQQQFSFMRHLLLDNNYSKQKQYNQVIYQCFLNQKSTVESTILVCVQLQDYYLSFDDDAIILALQREDVLLYQCNVFGLRGKTCTILSQYQLNDLLLMGVHIVTTSSPQHSLLYKMGLRESNLYHKRHDSLSYQHVVLRKRIDGEYMISAVHNSVQLPGIPVDKRLAAYYNRLPECLEKQAILSSLVHTAFDKILIQQ